MRESTIMSPGFIKSIENMKILSEEERKNFDVEVRKITQKRTKETLKLFDELMNDK